MLMGITFLSVTRIAQNIMFQFFNMILRVYFLSLFLSLILKDKLLNFLEGMMLYHLFFLANSPENSYSSFKTQIK